MITANGTGCSGAIDESNNHEDRNCQDSDESSARTLALFFAHRDEHRALILVFHFWVPNNVTQGRIPKRLEQLSLAEPLGECGHMEPFLIRGNA